MKSIKTSRKKPSKKVSRKSSKKVSRKSSKKVSRRTTKKVSRKSSKKVSRKSSKKVSRRTTKKVSRKSSKKVSRKSSKKVSRKSSKKVSRKSSKKVSRKKSKKVSRKNSPTKKTLVTKRPIRKPKKDIPMPLPIFPIKYPKEDKLSYIKTPAGFKLQKIKTAVTAAGFQGYPIYNLSAMLYLTKKHKNACSIVPHSRDMIKLRLKPTDSDFFDPFPRLDAFDKNITIDASFWGKFKECINNQKRFIIIPITVCLTNTLCHANILIYDTVKREMERFEPYGSIHEKNPSLNARFDFFDKLFQKELKSNNVNITEYFKPLDFCPASGFQLIEEDIENVRKATGDPWGFCQAWSEWYADLRLSNPDSSRDEVIQIAIRKIKQEPKGFKNFIRSYANLISRITVDFYKNGWNASIIDTYLNE